MATTIRSDVEDIVIGPQQIAVTRGLPVVIDDFDEEIDIVRVRAKYEPTDIQGDPKWGGRVPVISNRRQGIRIWRRRFVDIRSRNGITDFDRSGQNTTQIIHTGDFCSDGDADRF